MSLQIIGLIALRLYVRRNIRRWHDKQKIRSTELLFLAQHDALTGVGNRALFELRMADAIKQSLRNANPIGLMLIDINTQQVICVETLLRWQHPEKGDMHLAVRSMGLETGLPTISSMETTRLICCQHRCQSINTSIPQSKLT